VAFTRMSTPVGNGTGIECVSSDLIRQSYSEAGGRGAGRGSHKRRDRGLPSGESETKMTQERKIIRAKVDCWNRPSSSAMSDRPCKMMGYSRDSFCCQVRFDQRIPFIHSLSSVSFRLFCIDAPGESRCVWRHCAKQTRIRWRFGQNHDAAFASFAETPGANPICRVAASHLLERRSGTWRYRCRRR
jgi:hypothetical protein